MGIFRKIPVEIEAFKFYVDDMPDWFMDKVSSNEVVLVNCDYSKYRIEEAYCEMKTIDGIVRINGGDYIIKSAIGNIYYADTETLWKTFERVK